jgi:hypothetical protein
MSWRRASRSPLPPDPKSGISERPSDLGSSCRSPPPHRWRVVIPITSSLLCLARVPVRAADPGPEEPADLQLRQAIGLPDARTADRRPHQRRAHPRPLGGSPPGRRGTVTASLIMRQLASYPRQNGIAAALSDGQGPRARSWLSSSQDRSPRTGTCSLHQTATPIAFQGVSGAVDVTSEPRVVFRATSPPPIVGAR